eukprot:c44809_g1_i1 orf=109-369(+)
MQEKERGFGKCMEYASMKATNHCSAEILLCKGASPLESEEPYFLELVTAIGSAGSLYVPPSYHCLRTTKLVDEVKCIDHEIMGVRK